MSKSSPRGKITTVTESLLEQCKVVFPTAQKVSDGVGEDYQYKWTPHTPVLISAMTGAGKNHFVESDLLPYAIKNNMKILILSNRIALSRQIKLHIATLIKKFDIKLGRRLEAEIEKYSLLGLDDMFDFGPVVVKSYQGITSLKGVIDPSEFAFVIIDEAQYFVSDSRFNAQTEEQLDYIIREFSNSVRVYMTATPDDVFPFLLLKENEMRKEIVHRIHLTSYRDYLSLPQNREIVSRLAPMRLQNISTRLFALHGYAGESYTYNGCERHLTYNEHPFVVYHFERNYSYLDVQFLEKDSDYPAKSVIVEKVKKEIEKGDKSKWLVFIKSIDEGTALVKAIGKEYAVAINASSKIAATVKEERQIYDELALEELYAKKILVSTAVLSNGVNINDFAVKNVFVDSFNKADTLQMLGRVRVRSAQQKIKLYLPAFGADDIKDIINKNEEILDMFYEYDLLEDHEKVAFHKQFFHASKQGKSSFDIYADEKIYYSNLLKAYLQAYNVSLAKLYAKATGKAATEDFSFDYNDFIVAHYKKAGMRKACQVFSEHFISTVKGEKAVVGECMSWFGKANEDFEPKVEDVKERKAAEQELLAFLEARSVLENITTVKKWPKEMLLQQGMEEKAQDDFVKNFYELYNAAFKDAVKGRKSDGTYGLKTINKILSAHKYPYHVVSKQVKLDEKEKAENVAGKQTKSIWVLARKSDEDSESITE